MIDALKGAAVESAPLYIAWGGLAIGILFGFTVQRTNFCTMGSLSDILAFGNWNRFRAWFLAIAVAILGVWAVQATGIADMSLSMYRSPSLGWGANIVGGAIFGFGMVFSGGCISRNLVRAGGGDMRSLFVLLVTGIFGYMTIGGILGPMRVALFSPLTTDLSASGITDQGAGPVLAGMLGVDAGTATTLATFGLAAALLVFCFANGEFRRSKPNIAGGIGIGLCVVLGWALTGITYDDFANNPTVISLSYVRPVGDSLDYLMRYTALGAPGFGVVTVAGALLGGFVGAVTEGRFRITTFANGQDAVRNSFGAALMGVGGVLALGCTVGQGLTGVSTLAVGSVLTLISIITGGVVGVKVMESIA